MAATAPAPATARKAKPASKPPTPEPIPEPAYVAEVLTRISVDLIDVGENVRKTVGDVSELAASIAQVGVLQPIKVLGPFADTGRYALIYGQRRLTAVRSLGWTEVKAVVVAPGSLGADAKTERVIEQLLENAQREDLAPLELAAALRVLVDQAGTQAEVARRLGKSEGWVSSTLKLLGLTPEVTKLVVAGELSASHAEAIASAPAKEQIELAQWAIQQGASAKGLERHVQWSKGESERVESNQARLTIEREARVKKLIANLVKRNVPKAGQIIRVVGWGDDRPKVAAALRKHGYEDVDTSSTYGRSQPAKEFCNCKAWQVEVSYGEYRITPTCVVDAHGEAARKAAIDAQDAKTAEDRALQKRLGDAVLAELEAKPLGRLTLQLMFAARMQYRLEDWAKGRPGAGDKKKPDAWGAICAAPNAELMKHVADDFAGFYAVPVKRVVAWLDDQKATES